MQAAGTENWKLLNFGSTEGWRKSVEWLRRTDDVYTRFKRTERYSTQYSVVNTNRC